MTGNAAALRLPARAAARPRRRKRRPPNRRERRAIGLCVLCVFIWFVALPGMAVVFGAGPLIVWPLAVPGGAFGAHCRLHEWPCVKNYLKNGWMDDD